MIVDHPAVEPREERRGNTFTYTYPSKGFRLELKVRPHGQSLRARIHVYHLDEYGTPDAVVIAGHSALLDSTPARRDLAKELSARRGGPNWTAIVEHAFTRTEDRFYEPRPLLDLDGVEAPDRVEYLCRPFVVRRDTNILAGLNSSGKSFTALFLVSAVQMGDRLPAQLSPARNGQTCVWDWETREQEYKRRIRWIGRGLGRDDRSGILYRFCDRPVTDMTDQINDDIRAHGIVFGLFDSLGPMCGGDLNNTASALAAMNAIRACGSEPGMDFDRLVLAHVRKESDSIPIHKWSIFGSGFFGNLARNVWIVGKSSDENDPNIDQLFHEYKHNNGRKERDFALRLAFDDDAMTVRLQWAQAAEVAAFAGHLPVPRRILDLVARLGQVRRDPKWIWEQLKELDPDLKPDAVRQAISRLVTSGQLLDIGGFLALPSATPLRAVVGAPAPIQPAAYPDDDDEELPF